MDKEVLENHKNYLERISFFKTFGYDLEKERDFIFDRSMPISGDILEIGTGKGHFALALAKRGYSFTSIDISREEHRIALLNLKYHGLEKYVDLRIEDAGGLSFRDRSFDTIFSVNVYHHLEKPRAFLDEVARILRPSGKVIVSDFNAKGMQIINDCHTREGRVHDYFKHDMTAAAGYFLDKGFEVHESQSQTQRVICAKRVPEAG